MNEELWALRKLTEHVSDMQEHLTNINSREVIKLAKELGNSVKLELERAIDRFWEEERNIKGLSKQIKRVVMDGTECHYVKRAVAIVEIAVREWGIKAEDITIDLIDSVNVYGSEDELIRDVQYLLGDNNIDSIGYINANTPHRAGHRLRYWLYLENNKG